MVNIDALADAVQAAQPMLALAVTLLGMLVTLRVKGAGKSARHAA